MDKDRHFPENLIDFPCDFTFKAFGPNDGVFPEKVREAASTVLPVPLDAVRVRASSGQAYVCVSLVAHLQSPSQLTEIYQALRRVEGLRYLL